MLLFYIIRVTTGRGEDTVGNPRRAQIVQFELFELILSLKLDKQFPVEQFEAAAVSQSTVPSPPLGLGVRRGDPWVVHGVSVMVGSQGLASRDLGWPGAGTVVHSSRSAGEVGKKLS